MGTVLQLTTNFVSQAYSILLVVMEDSFGWSLTLTAIAYSMRAIVSALLAPWAGVMGDRYGAKRVMLIGAGFFGGGLGRLGRRRSITDTPTPMYLNPLGFHTIPG